MNINEAKNKLTVFFTEKWEKRTLISYENKIDKYVEGNVPFVRMFIKMSTGGQQTLGSPGDRMFRRTGYLLFQIFVPSGKGTKTADDFAQNILDIFETEDVGGILIRNGSANYEGGDGKWYNQNVQFNISFDEFK